jgi:hypothetical protein
MAIFGCQIDNELDSGVKAGGLTQMCGEIALGGSRAFEPTRSNLLNV